MLGWYILVHPFTQTYLSLYVKYVYGTLHKIGFFNQM